MMNQPSGAIVPSSDMTNPTFRKSRIKSPRWLLRWILLALAGFLLTALLFFTGLAAWNLVLSPFIQMESASFVIICFLMGAVGLACFLLVHISRQHPPRH
jgi:cytochrome b subunit of formate dehydrogenase